MHLRRTTAPLILAITAACSDLTTAPKDQPPRPLANLAAASGQVTITPVSDTVEVGQTIRLTATVQSPTGTPTSEIRLVWGVDDTTIAALRDTGQIEGKRAGKARIVAIAKAGDTAIGYGFGNIIVREPQGAIASIPGAAALLAGYSTTSAHWPHLRTMMTDFYYGWTPSERSWAAAHYDFAMSGSTSAWKGANPTVGHLRYTLEWTVILPGHGQPGLANHYYEDMQAWYRRHPQYDLESAFLHVPNAETRDKAHRLVVRIWDSPRWVINPADPGAREYTIDRFRRVAAGEDGVFIDEAGSGDILGRIKGGSAELPNPADFQQPHTTLLREIKQALGNKMVMLNTATYTREWDRANILAAGAAHLEGMNDPLHAGMPSRWKYIEGLLADGAFVDFVNLYSSEWIDAHSGRYPRGNYATSAKRLKMWELASYYMVVPASPDRFALQLENTWTKPYSSLWLKAQEINIGHPRGARHVYRTGTDRSGRPYTVYAREFDRALVLVRPTPGWDTQSHGDGTAAEIPLPSSGEWLPLRADGTLGSPVRSVTLRSAEAMILIDKSAL